MAPLRKLKSDGLSPVSKQNYADHRPLQNKNYTHSYESWNYSSISIIFVKLCFLINNTSRKLTK